MYCREARSRDSTVLVRHERGFYCGNSGTRVDVPPPPKVRAGGLVRTHGRSPHGRKIMDYQLAKLVSGFVVIARKRCVACSRSFVSESIFFYHKNLRNEGKGNNDLEHGTIIILGAFQIHE